MLQEKVSIMPQVPELSVVIPAYNEARHIPLTLQAIEDYASSRNLTHEIMVVDDGSRDDTAQVTRSLTGQFPGLKIVCNGVNRGKGFSVRRGMLEASGNLVLMYDADQSTPIEELDKLLPFFKAGTTDIAIGSRALKDSQIEVHQPFYREPLGFVFNDLIQLLVIRGIKDTQCGFKLFRQEAARDVFARATIDGFAFDVEALLIAQKLNYRIAEVPIRWRNDANTSIRLFRHGSRMVTDLFRIRWNSMRGKYNAA